MGIRYVASSPCHGFISQLVLHANNCLFFVSLHFVLRTIFGIGFVDRDQFTVPYVP